MNVKIYQCRIFMSPFAQESVYLPITIPILKSARRHLERKYISTHSVEDYKILRTATNQYHRLIAHAKRKFYAQLIQSSIPNPRLLWKNINSLLHRLTTSSYYIVLLHRLLHRLTTSSYYMSYYIVLTTSYYIVSNFHLTLHQCHLIPTPLFLLKYYHHLLLHLSTKSLNSCMPLLINNVTSTLSPHSS